jgi:predicted exporter
MRTRGKSLLPWLVFHCALFLALAVSSALLGPPGISASLFDILPRGEGLRSAGAADAVLSGRNGRRIVILAGSADFSLAKSGAAELYPALAESPGFESLEFSTGQEYLSAFSRYLFDYRFMLLDKEERELLEQGGAAEFAGAALASAYGAFHFGSLENLEDDPFLLSERLTRRFLDSSLTAGGNVSIKEDVLAAPYEGNWYVLIRGVLSPRGTEMTNRESAVKTIYEKARAITQANPGLKFYYSGVPFHSYESSSHAQKEISLISTISLAAALLLFLRVFRSPFPAFASLAAAGLSILSALCAALLFFRQVHVLTFVFGTTLIGTCIDYSLHYFVHRMGLPDLEASAIRSRIFRGIAMSCASTLVCFSALLFAPFGILKQFAVFSLAGLASSFLSVMCIFPLVWKKGPGPRKGRAFMPGKKAASFLKPAGSRLGPLLLLGVSLLCLCLLFFKRAHIKIENRLGDLYTMSEGLLESEGISAKALQYGSAPWYFIVSGRDPQETLETEERLRAALDREIAEGNAGSLMASSLFVPSIQTQRQSYEAAKKLLPLLDSQFENLGFPREAAGVYRRNFAGAEKGYLLPESGAVPADLLSGFWIGRVGERYYSCVMPLHAKDAEPFRAIAGEMDNVFFVNKIRDTGIELDRLTGIMLGLFMAALGAIAVIARCFYSWKRTLRICAVPLFVFLVVLAVLVWLEIPPGFFPMVGLLLVFGLGLDYMFYITESEKVRDSGQGLTFVSIFLSFATSALSFGALALSSFAPVHIFGLTVFSGLCAAYLSAMLLRK